MAFPDIDDAFVKQFESEAHIEYQQMGSKLRNTVRTKAGVTGESTTFQVIGNAVAGTKSRNGDIPVQDVSHAPVECTLQDRYAGIYVDDLDELKIYFTDRTWYTTKELKSTFYGRGFFADWMSSVDE